MVVVVEHFTLQDLAKYNEGRAEGYLELSWTDGTQSDTLDPSETNNTIAISTPGSWTLTAELYFEDGDEVSEEFSDFAPASLAFTVE